MAQGKLGLILAVGMLVLLPVERWQFSGLEPVDAFIVLTILLAWPFFWRHGTRVCIPLVLAMLCIFGGGLVGALSGRAVPTALIAMVQEMYLFVAFVTVANLFFEEKVFLTFRKAWVIVAAVESVLLVVGRFGVTVPYLGSGAQLKLGTAIAGDAGAVLAERGRSLGSFINPNAAAGYMLISFFILLMTPYPRNRLLRAGLIGLFFVGILSSGSSSGTLGTVVGLSVATLYWQYQRGRAVLLGLGLGSLATAAVIFMMLSWSLILPSIVSIMGPPDAGSPLVAFGRFNEKLSARFAIWAPGLEVFPTFPLGIGPNASKTVVGISMHNDYVAFLVERGPLGFIGLMLLIAGMLSWLAQASKNAVGWSHHWATGALLGALVGMCIVSSAHEVTHGRPVWLLFAVIVSHARFVGAKVPTRERILPGRTQPSVA